jgi:hypothetical protein
MEPRSSEVRRLLSRWQAHRHRRGDSPQLVAIDPAAGGPGRVVGRVVDGAATARALRDQIAGARGRPVSIVSITRLVFL